MTTRQLVSARQLERTRRRGARLVSEALEHGDWSVDEQSAGLLVSLYGRLSIIPEFRLVTYAWRGGTGGTGWTFAIPARTETPTVEQLVRADGFVPEPPPGALGDPMAALEGDGSLRSYVQASILGRELAELGAWWHGLEWSTHTLVGPSDDPGRPAVYDGSLYAVEPAGMFDDSEWVWSERQPGDWRPRAEREADRARVTVTFWSYSELGTSAVYEHRDLYEGNGLVPSRAERRPLGTGPSGYVF